MIGMTSWAQRITPTFHEHGRKSNVVVDEIAHMKMPALANITSIRPKRLSVRATIFSGYLLRYGHIGAHDQTLARGAGRKRFQLVDRASGKREFAALLRQETSGARAIMPELAP